MCVTHARVRAPLKYLLYMEGCSHYKNENVYFYIWKEVGAGGGGGMCLSKMTGWTLQPNSAHAHRNDDRRTHVH